MIPQQTVQTYHPHISSTDAEQNLLAALAHGDQSAFWPLWEVHSSRLYGICLREMNRNHADAEDALTQAMLKALQKLPVFAAKINHPGAWLTRVTYNVCRDIHRSRTRRPVVAFAFESTNELLHVPAPPELTRESPPSVELQEDPESIIDYLPARLRDVFAMRFIQELSYKEISIRLALTQVTVRKRIQHARATLRALRDKTTFDNRPNNLARIPKAAVVKTTALASHPAFEIPARGFLSHTIWVRLSSGAVGRFEIFLDKKPSRQKQKIRTLRKYVAQHGNGWKKRLALADLLYQTGGWAEAVEGYRHVLQKRPWLTAISVRLAGILTLMDCREEAIEVYKLAKAFARQPATRCHLRGLIELRRHNLPVALKFIQQAALLEPENAAHRQAWADIRALSTGSLPRESSENGECQTRKIHISAKSASLEKTTPSTHMTRILYWNLDNFSLPKIWAIQPEGVVMAAVRSNLINGVMTGPVGGPPPDIIVVVEVYSRVREVGIEGTVLDAGRNAGAGVLQLLGNIRQALNNPTWCVVPPLNVGLFGQQEAVAVFYNATNLQFTGPNLYFDRYPGTPGTVVGQSQPVAVNTSQHILDYPLPWQNALPIQMNRQHNFPGVGAINEWQLAGEWQYWGVGRPIPSPEPPVYPNNRIQFPAQGSRGPFWTQFSDLTVPQPRRLINLFTVHTSPVTAWLGVNRMQQVQQMAAPAAPGTVSVILGDFNVDSFDPGGFGGGMNAYWMAAPAGIYTMQLDPRVGHAGAPNPNRKPYCMTHLLRLDQGTPFNTGGGAPIPTQNVYPRYGYMGSSFPQINDSGAIDNIFTAYGAGAPGAPANITVVNKIVGTPYDRIQPAPQGVTGELTGGQHFASALANPIPQPGGINPPVCTIGFPQLFNYGQVRRTSDHLPLMIDI